jgi:putative flippase GtrA
MKTFLRANASSLTASFCDYLVTFTLMGFLQVDPVIASVLGTVVGGIVNFLIGRHWAFKSSRVPFFQQGRKYLLTWVGNLILNALGVYLLNKQFGVDGFISKIVTSLTVSIAYNYPIQKKYVFKNIDIDEKD